MCCDSISARALREAAWPKPRGGYEATFLDNAIGINVLPELTEDDLSHFGVLFGDRKRLLKVIESLGSTESAPKPPTAIVPPDPLDRATCLPPLLRRA